MTSIIVYGYSIETAAVGWGIFFFLGGGGGDEMGWDGIGWRRWGKFITVLVSVVFHTWRWDGRVLARYG